MDHVDYRSMLSNSLAQLRRGRRTLNKWVLNLSALLIFVAGGQRPQVYCHLLVPDEAVLIEIERDPEQEYVELQVAVEKVPRGHTIPTVLLPKKIMRYLLFHVNLMLRWLMILQGRDLRQIPPILLLDTRTGNILSSCQVAVLCGSSWSVMTRNSQVSPQWL